MTMAYGSADGGINTLLIRKEVKHLMIDLDLDRPGSYDALLPRLRKKLSDRSINKNKLSIALTGFKGGGKRSPSRLPERGPARHEGSLSTKDGSPADPPDASGLSRRAGGRIAAQGREDRLVSLLRVLFMAGVNIIKSLSPHRDRIAEIDARMEQICRDGDFSDEIVTEMDSLRAELKNLIPLDATIRKETPCICH